MVHAAPSIYGKGGERFSPSDLAGSDQIAALRRYNGRSWLGASFGALGSPKDEDAEHKQADRQHQVTDDRDEEAYDKSAREHESWDDEETAEQEADHCCDGCQEHEVVLKNSRQRLFVKNPEAAVEDDGYKAGDQDFDHRAIGSVGEKDRPLPERNKRRTETG